MAKQQIDKKYLREFFKLGEGDSAERELIRIAKSLERMQFENGQDICTIDAEPDGMYFLESGSAAVLDRNGAQINIMRDGQYFGEYAVLAQQRRLSTVRSIGRTVVYRMSNEDLLRTLQRHPGVYGELMKRVYNQVSSKHAQLTLLSSMRRGILQVPGNETPMTKKQMLINYGAVALIFALSVLFAPKQSIVPVFVIPLVFMVAYVLHSKRTLGSLIVSGMLAAVLALKSGLCVGYTDALLETMSAPDNAFTVLVMALMGGVVTLIESSGAVTAFKKLMGEKVHSRTQSKLAAVCILALTAIDDCLNMLCASASLRTVSNEHRVPREEMSLLLSLLPTVFCSFLPFSLWGIFVISNINAATGGQGVVLLIKSIPYNYFSLVTVAAMLLFCFGKLPRSGILRDAEKRVAGGGSLWPSGSERYLPQDEGEIWGRPGNLLLPVLALGVASVTLRSIRSGSAVLDSASGLVATLVFMFFLYCAQELMSPERFLENMVSGIQSMTLPIILYLLTMCFSTLLEQEAMGSFFDSVVSYLAPVSPFVPALLFLIFTLLTMALGSSWAMYVIGFPIAMHIARRAGLDIPLCIGAVCASGIAGEKLCVFTGDSLSVGTAIGCEPRTVLKLRLTYSIALSVLSLLIYTAAGFITSA
ncbi:MAG: cyclic nucleotide-binding domain-containing protein [Oscillospiraceae bacterium]|nr:cyclic nucleotide-binding domain-containing protein [Oscillospiraceae bacterium]